MANPKIVYTLDDGSDQTLTFLFPPKQQPAYVKTAVRHDNISTAGVRESILEHVDDFLEITMDSIRSGADLEAFDKFAGTESLPFRTGKYKRIAVKVIDPRGNEVMAVRQLEG